MVFTPTQMWPVGGGATGLELALYLAEQGWEDRDRLAIDGGSAGGYTTLGALTFRDVFKAGASYYGVSDMIALAEETHKFESRYLDGLVGPYPAATKLEAYLVVVCLLTIGGFLG